MFTHNRTDLLSLLEETAYIETTNKLAGSVAHLVVATK